MKQLVLFIFSVACALPACSQVSDRQPELPDYLLEIRARQRTLAAQEEIEIQCVDRERRSSCRIEGVPRSLRNLRISTRHDLLANLDFIYSLYGLTNGESLSYLSESPFQNRTIYKFQQLINGIGLSRLLDISVDSNSKLINEFNGNLITNRNFPREHMLSESEAINATLAFIKKNEGSDLYRLNGNHFAELCYKNWGEDDGLSPWWMVNIEMRDGPGPSEVFNPFQVDPNGVVSSGTINIP